MGTKEIDEALDRFVDGVIVADDRYYYSIDEFVEHYMDNASTKDELPEAVNGTSKVLFGYCSAADVAEGLWEDVVCHDFAPKKDFPGYWLHNNQTAENLTQWALESLYSFCEDDQDWDDVNGLDDLQSSIDVFRSLNQTIWLLTRHIKAYDPRKHSIGLRALQKALDKAALLNHHHIVYHYNPNQVVKLSIEWWIESGWDANPA